MVKNILIFGGSGFLGRNLIKHYLSKQGFVDYRITSVSRSETRVVEARDYIRASCKNYNKATFLIGDMADESFVNKAIFSMRPDIVIVAAAMKHIHLCEENPQQATKVNILGTTNVVNAVSRLRESKSDVVLCYVSTDKACDPIGTYGFSKAIAERVVTSERAARFEMGHNTAVRYGNVLNSPMSIIPSIKERIRSGNKELFLTDERMTRFIMTVEQSVALIDYAVSNPVASGMICVPKLEAMRIKDLLEIFAEEYDCKITVRNFSVNEKFDERMVSELEQTNCVSSLKMPSIPSRKFVPEIHLTGPFVYQGENNSHMFVSNNKEITLSKEELREMLISLDLLKL